MTLVSPPRRLSMDSFACAMAIAKRSRSAAPGSAEIGLSTYGSLRGGSVGLWMGNLIVMLGVLLAGLTIALGAGPAQASWISEISPATRSVWSQDVPASLADLPPYVEITLTTPRSNQLDLILVNASTSSSRYGKILSVFSLNIPTTGSPTTHLLIDNSLGNATPWPNNTDPDWSQLQTLATLSPDTLDIRTDTALALMLFDGNTGLSAVGGLKIHQVDWKGATLDDVVTFGPEALAQAFPGNPQAGAGAFGETVLAISAGQIIARPLENLETPTSALHLVGTPDAHNLLTSPESDVALLLNPGLVNLSTFTLTHAPEPTTLSMIIGLFLATGRFRMRNPWKIR